MSFFHKHKKLYFLFKIVMILIACVVVFAFSYSGYLNAKFTKDMVYDENLGKAKYISEENGYIFKYKRANPWNLSCFASVCTSESAKMYVNEEGELQTNGMTITLFVWPSVKGYIYGIDMYENDDETTQLQLYIDEECNIISFNKENSHKEKFYSDNYELIQEYQSDIRELMNVAKEKWNLS